MAAPTVVDTTPSDGADEVAINISLIFEFDSNIDSDSVNSQTFQVFDLDTFEEINGNRSVSGKKITFVPLQAFFENRRFRAAAIGAASGGDAVKSSSGDPLAADFSIDFRTGRERYVPLTEVTTRTDIEGVGPIRAVTSQLLGSEAAAEEALELKKAKPKSFTSQVDPAIDSLVFTFNVAPSGSLDGLIDLETFPVLGIDDYVVDIDGTGLLWFQDCAPTGTVAGVTPPDFGTPTGTFTISGKTIVWTKGSSEPNFNYNEEVLFTFKEGIGTAGGGELADDVTVAYTTKFFPRFVGARYVRLELGPIASAVVDDTIERVIHKNSMMAFEHSGRNLDPTNPTPASRRYTAAQTTMDIIDMFTMRTAAEGGQSKSLGDLRIQKTPHAVEKYKEQRAIRDKALRELRYYRGQGKPRWVVKGASSYNARCDLWERTWDQLFWWNTLEPAANTTDLRQDRLSRSGDHDQATCPPLRSFLGGNGGLFTCKGHDLTT